MKSARYVAIGAFGVAVALAALMGAASRTDESSPGARYVVKVAPGAGALQLLYIADSFEGRIAVYEYDLTRRALKLVSVKTLEGRTDAANAGGQLALSVVRSGGVDLLYVVDPVTGKLAVYRHAIVGGALALLAVRDWKTDMRLDYYNAGQDGEDLTTEMIRRALPKK